ncbi:Uncharacterised protein [Klebsiella pneumoniae]|nr:Uncharacterised protein [Klebsiella pneumoniae]
MERKLAQEHIFMEMLVSRHGCKDQFFTYAPKSAVAIPPFFAQQPWAK